MIKTPSFADILLTMLLLGFLLLILGVAVLSLMPENGYAPRPGEGALHHIIMRR